MLVALLIQFFVCLFVRLVFPLYVRPDVDGVLASMTVALALEGCSVVGLHAAKSASPSERVMNDDNDTNLIQDVFSVVNRTTGQPFGNDELERLAQALVKAVQSPMKALGSNSMMLDGNDDDKNDTDDTFTDEPVISIIPSSK